MYNVTHILLCKDGMRVHYVVLVVQGVRLDGKKRTLLSGYNGFPFLHVPSEAAPLSALGSKQAVRVYVEGIIRGSGEYGPAWHSEPLKENRLSEYEELQIRASNCLPILKVSETSCQ